MEIGIHVGAIRAYLEACSKEGIDRNSLLLDLGIPEAMLENGNSKLPLSKMRSLQNLARAAVRTPGLDLKAGYNFAVGTFGPFHYLMQSRTTLRESFLDICRFGHLISEYASYSLTESGSTARFAKHLLVPSQLIDTHTASFCMAAVLSSTRKIIGEDWCPSEVRFRQKKPFDPTPFEQIFGPVVKFECETDEMIFPSSLLDQKLITQDTVLGAVLECFMSGSNVLKCGPRFHERVSQVIMSQFLQGLPTLPQVAKLMGLTSRSLQRHLQHENTSFLKLTDEVRKELARVYVLCLGMAMKDAAIRLHFSDSSTFSRACRRWFASGSQKVAPKAKF